MDRRRFLRFFSAATVAGMSGELLWRGLPVAPVSPSSSPASVAPGAESLLAKAIEPAVLFEDLDTSQIEMAASIQYMATPAPDRAALQQAFEAFQAGPQPEQEPQVPSYLAKMKRFEEAHLEDVFLSPEQNDVLLSSFRRLDRVQQLVGHGNFNVIGFDEMIRLAAQYEQVGAFTEAELSFLDEIFNENASRYGFLGEKVITQLTEAVPERDRIKVKGSGHFLFRGEAEGLYRKVQQDVGTDIILTSGIRSVVKQTYLFLAKTIQAKGNLSRASRSLAPPGHSFHGVGDFDVGQRGYGARNFTNAFADSDVFKRLVQLGYVDMRYPMDNLFGVRYEPWHIKVV